MMTNKRCLFIIPDHDFYGYLGTDHGDRDVHLAQMGELQRYRKSDLLFRLFIFHKNLSLLKSLLPQTGDKPEPPAKEDDSAEETAGQTPEKSGKEKKTKKAKKSKKDKGKKSKKGKGKDKKKKKGKKSKKGKAEKAGKKKSKK